MSLREVSTQAGISHTYIRNLELGTKKDPSHEVLSKLAKVYKVSYGQLLSQKFKYLEYPYLPELEKELHKDRNDIYVSLEKFKLEGTHLDIKEILEGEFTVFYNNKKLTLEQKQVILGILKAVFKEE